MLVALLETRVEFDADMIENMTRRYQLSNSSHCRRQTKSCSRKSRTFRKDDAPKENIIDKQHTVSGMLRSEFIPNELQPKLTIIIKDINSLVEQSSSASTVSTTFRTPSWVM